MGDFVRFVSRSDLERARLIREARAIYESVFPTEEVGGAHRTTATPGREKADDMASRPLSPAPCRSPSSLSGRLPADASQRPVSRIHDATPPQR